MKRAETGARVNAPSEKTSAKFFATVSSGAPALRGVGESGKKREGLSGYSFSSHLRAKEDQRERGREGGLAGIDYSLGDVP